MKRTNRPGKSARLFIAKHKLFVGIASGLLVVLLIIGGFTAWSLAQWREYDQHTTSQQRAFRESLAAALALPADTSEAKAKKRVAIQAASTAFAAQQRICDVSWLTAWQQRLFEPAKKRVDDCRASLAALDTLRGDVDRTMSYLQHEQALASLIATATDGANEQDEALWQATSDKWQTLTGAIKNMKVSSEFEPVRARAGQLAELVSAGWKELLAAHTVKDRSRYEKAVGELDKAYVAFQALSQDDVTTMAALLQPFETLSDK